MINNSKYYMLQWNDQVVIKPVDFVLGNNFPLNNAALYKMKREAFPQYG
jgi:hypothetical protein